MEPANDIEQTKEQILDAADLRFTQYGLNKTTMAEIAKDCRMSAANLYRYFENKMDICAGLACRCLCEDEGRLLQIVNRDDLDAEQKLRLFIHQTLDYMYEQWSRKPRMNEVVQAVITERKDLVDSHHDRKRSILIAILKQGIAQGDFEVRKLEQVAETVLFAIIPFDVPFFMNLYSFDQFKVMADSLAQLILDGVRRRGS